MSGKKGFRSYYPGWAMATRALAAAGVTLAVLQLVDPQPVSALEARRWAAWFLCLGLGVFWLVTSVDGLIDMIRDMRQEERERPERERRLREAREAAEREARGEHLPQGLCGNRESHGAHEHQSRSLGLFWCTADESQRLPFAAERRRKDKA